MICKKLYKFMFLLDRLVSQGYRPYADYNVTYFQTNR